MASRVAIIGWLTVRDKCTFGAPTEQSPNMSMIYLRAYYRGDMAEWESGTGKACNSNKIVVYLGEEEQEMHTNKNT